ncbi:MAG: branched-chain amino acid ABC transporter substrate-binding protein [Anaerolineae bacterium]
MMGKKALIPLLLVLALGLAGTTGAQEPIKIGVQGPITGKWAYEGEGFVKVVTLLADQINEQGGLLGRQIEIIEGDDKGEPSDAALVADKMVTEGVVAVIGSYSSTCTEPASAIYNEANILQITPSSTATVLTTKGYKQFFRTCFLDDRQGLFAAEKFIEWGLKKAAFLHDNSTYAKGLADWAKKYYEERGGETVFYDAITPGEEDYTPILTKIKAAAPDVIYFTGYHPDGGLLVKQAKELGLTPDILFTAGNACNNPEFVDIAGVDAAEGVLVSTEPLPHDLPYPEAKKFIEDFEAKYGEPPASIWWLMAADAFNVIAEAIRATESTDTDVLAEYLHTEFKDYPGVTGPIIGFDEKGDRLGTVHKWYRINDKGEFVPYEVPAAEATPSEAEPTPAKK